VALDGEAFVVGFDRIDEAAGTTDTAQE